MENENDKLTIGDLSIGDKFIVFPEPGDNKGHGGYKGTHWIFQKVSPIKGKNAVRLAPPPQGVENLVSLPDAMPVIKVE